MSFHSHLPRPRRRAAQVVARGFALAAGFLLAACGGDGGARAADEVFARERRHPLIGLDETVPAEGVLGHVIAARLMEGGDHVVVLDFVAPYVKVFDRSGRFVRAFLREGRGPAEARRPTAIGVSGDSLVLVWDAARRMMVFDISGRLRSTTPYPGFPVLAAVPGCGDGEWVVYGPRFEPNSDRATWLHRIRLGQDGALASRDAFRDSLAARMVPGGVAYGMVARDNTAYVWHTLGARRLLAAWKCGDAEPRVVYQARATDAAPRSIDLPDGTRRMEITANTRAPAGMAALDGGVLVGEFVQERDPRGGRTELTYLGADGTEEKVRLPGSYVIRDSQAGVGVLLSTTDPAPQLFLVPEPQLTRVFRRRP